MRLIEKLKSLFTAKNPEPAVQPEKTVKAVKTEPSVAQQAREMRTCKNCGKSFGIDPSWEHIPNYCRECRQKFAREKEERQRSGEPRKIKRKCKNCGKFFTFPSTLPHYPNYCNNCRKQHQTAMKEKYGKPVKRKKTGEEK